MSEHSATRRSPSMANEVGIGVVAGVLWLFFAAIGVLLAGLLALGAFVATWANEEPVFSAPIEWRATAHSDEWRGEQTPVLVRLELDGSAWVERFPIAPMPEGPLSAWIGNCVDPRYTSTYTGPVSWSSAIGGGVELDVLSSTARISTLRHNWTSPKISGCDYIFDIDLEIVCGDPGFGERGDWTPCLPVRP